MDARLSGLWTAVALSLLGVLFAAPQSAPAADAPRTAQPELSWTLERCEREALSSSPRLAEAAARREGAAAAAAAARARRWPVLALQGGYSYVSEVMRLRLAEILSPGAPEIELGRNHAVDLQLSAEAPLFTGGALAGEIRAREAAGRAAHHEVRAESLAVLHDVRQAYFGALGAVARQQVEAVATERLRRHIEELDAAIEIGTGTPESRLQAFSRLRRAEQRAIAAEGETRAARLVLGHALGRAGSEVHPAGDLSRSLLPADSTARAPAIDAAARPELAALSALADRSRAATQAARADCFPSLVARAALHEGRPGVDPVADEWMSYATAGLVLRWSLWEWGARNRRLESARAEERAVAHRRTAALDGYVQALSIARAQWEAAQAQEAKAGERVALERQRRELVTGRYRDGAASESERLDAEDDLAQAESEWAAARARVRLAEADLLQFAVGQ